MRRYHRSQLLLLVFYVLSSFSSTTALVFPIFNPQPFVAARTSFPSFILPPSTQTSSSISDGPVLLPAVTRRQGEALPLDLSQEKEPSCAELKTMWRKMRRISRQMEITNEIPKLQDPFVSSAYNYRPSKYPVANPYSLAKSSRIKVFQSPSTSYDMVNGHTKSQQKPIVSSRNFGKIIRNPDEHRYSMKNKMTGSSIIKSGRPTHMGFDEFGGDIQETTYRGRGRTPGRFANKPLPEDALGVYGTVVHTPEERAKYRSRSRRPPSPGFRSRLVGGNNGPIGRVPFRASKPYGGYHYGSVVTHFPAERSGVPSNEFSGRNGPSITRSRSIGGFAEFPTEIGQRSPSGAPRVERIDKIAYAEKLKNSCLRMQNKTCKSDVECFCIGNPKLFCGGNRCLPRFKAQKYGRTPKWGQSLIVDPYEIDLSEYGFKRDPLWPSPF